MRQLALIAAKVAISAALLYFATGRINVGMIGDRLTQLNLNWLLVAIAVGILQTVLGAIRWQRVAVLCGATLPPRQALRFNMIAVFFNQVLPSTVGGDAARILLVARAGAGWWPATYSVLLDRFIGVLILAALVTGGLYWSFGLIANPVGRMVLIAVGLGSLAASAAFLAIGYWRLFGQWKSTRRLAEMAVLARHILFSRDCSLPIVVLSLIVHALTPMIGWSVARSVAAQLGYIDAFLLMLPVMLIATIPISIAGWGVRETALVLAFSYAALPEADGLIVSVLFGAVMFTVGLIGGIVWLVSPNTVRISTAWRSEPAPPP